MWMSKVNKATRPQEKETGKQHKKCVIIYEIFIMRFLKTIFIRSDKWLQRCEVANYSAMKLEIVQMNTNVKGSSINDRNIQT